MADFDASLTDQRDPDPDDDGKSVASADRLSRRGLLAAGGAAAATAGFSATTGTASAAPGKRVLSSPWRKIAPQIYQAVVSDDPKVKERALRGLKDTGMSKREANIVYATAASLAEKVSVNDDDEADADAGLDNFVAILSGEMPVPVQLSAQEFAMIGGIARQTKVWGNTWEGSTTRDPWEGSAYSFKRTPWAGTRR